MNPKHPWLKANEICLQVSDDIDGGFDIGFDKQIPEETRTTLRDFVSWVENNFQVPVKLWVDFEYKHYLVRRDGRRAGFLFHWADFNDYPTFNNREDIPIVRLPVRTEHSSMEEILTSFIEALSCYFAWICNSMAEGFVPDETEVEEILRAYLEASK